MCDAPIPCDTIQFTGKHDKIFTADFIKGKAWKKKLKIISPCGHKTSFNQNAIFIGYDALNLMFFKYAYKTCTPFL